MKKIIKNNVKDFGIQEFTCRWCDSVFESDEYDVGKTNNIGRWNLFKGIEMIPVYELETSCPACNKTARKTIPTGESAWYSDD